MNGSLILRCGERRLALPLADVFEVSRMVATAAKLPRAPRYCLGVIDFRGELVALCDLGARLGLTAPRDEVRLVDGHVLLARDPMGAIGWAVDEVMELQERAPEPLLVDGGGAIGRFVEGAVRCADGQVAPLLRRDALITVGAREELRVALAALREREAAL